MYMQFTDCPCSTQRTSSFAKKYFDALNDDVGTVDALEDWLANPIVNTSLDPVEYWTQMDGGRNPLARMALDYLSIPGTSMVIFSLRFTDISFYIQRALPMLNARSHEVD